MDGAGTVWVGQRGDNGMWFSIGKYHVASIAEQEESSSDMGGKGLRKRPPQHGDGEEMRTNTVTTHIHLYSSTHTHTHTLTHPHTHTLILVHPYTHAYTHTFRPIHLYKHTLIHPYTHTRTLFHPLGDGAGGAAGGRGEKIGGDKMGEHAKGKEKVGLFDPHVLEYKKKGSR
jgi:hypothetical protein